MKYDPATKVLTLQNAMIDIEEGHGIYPKSRGWPIRLIGVNNLKAKKAAIGFREALVITGGRHAQRREPERLRFLCH